MPPFTGFVQMPILAPACMSQLPLPAPGNPLALSPPQQSVSFKHRSPVTWQPLAGWQMSTPDGPGAHRRLQQSPQPLHSCPSTLVQYAGPVGGAAQEPTVWPVAITQLAVQQSPSRPHASPGWMQKDAPSAQCLLASHRPEQQPALAAQSLPAVLHLELSAVQVLLAPQVPPQHSALLVQALPSDTH
jgi:hypothetical protein